MDSKNTAHEWMLGKQPSKYSNLKKIGIYSTAALAIVAMLEFSKIESIASWALDEIFDRTLSGKVMVEQTTSGERFCLDYRENTYVLNQDTAQPYEGIDSLLAHYSNPTFTLRTAFTLANNGLTYDGENGLNSARNIPNKTLEITTSPNTNGLMEGKNYWVPRRAKETECKF